MQGIAVLALFFFSFFNLRKTPNTRLFRSVNISLFPAFDARRPAWHSTWRSLHIPIDPAQPFVGCCAAILVLFSAANKIAHSARSSCFPGPTKAHPPSHPRPTFNQALRRRIPQSAYLMGCYRFFCWPKITHSGPMCSRRTTLSGHSTWASPNNNHHPLLLLHCQATGTASVERNTQSSALDPSPYS